MNVSLDTNCLIDLEERRTPFVKSVEKVMELAAGGRLRLSVPASAASETPKPGNQAIRNFGRFEAFVSSLGLEVDYLAPILRVDMDFLGRSVVGTGPMVALEERIFRAIAPEGLEYAPPRSDGERKRWRNVVNDARALWCHIHYETDVLLTRDRRLIARGAGVGGNVMSPADFIGAIQSAGS